MKTTGLTLVEAIKSGRPFKQSHSFGWLDDDGRHTFSTKEVLATDWEIKPEPLVLETVINDCKTHEGALAIGLDPWHKFIKGQKVRVTIEVIR